MPDSSPQNFHPKGGADLANLGGKRVMVTGHTGFKGSWLCEWLLGLGATVSGYSLPPPTTPALFDQLDLAKRIDHRIGDVRNGDALSAALADVRPEVILHLAAQPIVRASYDDPVGTFASNVGGTVNLLDGIRNLAPDWGHPVSVVVVTTDKCYENREWLHAYRESDPLGGHDPYSASKACAELVASSYRASFFSTRDSNVRLASARAGNVIGGGDWAMDRIIPDLVRALAAGSPVPVRNPNATRPWQHVLEPLSGYLTLAARLSEECPDSALCSAFNFGPNTDSNRSVREVVDASLREWPGTWSPTPDPKGPHEAGKLNLATEKAFHLLGWRPRWDFDSTIRETISWYRQSIAASTPSPHALLTQQIAAYCTIAA